MKILLADDHALIRSGLRSELSTLASTVDFVEAWDAASLRQMFEQNRDLDLALVDLTMPGMLGAQSIAALRSDFPVVPLIVVSGVDGAREVHAVLRAGASGYIPKSAVAQVMLQAIRLVLAGGQYLPPQVMQAFSEASPEPAGDDALPSASGPEAVEPARLELLSPRQREVFALLAKGLSNKMIARELDITEGTVKSHVATIFDVLHVHNRVSAVAEARTLAESAERRAAGTKG
ncbi:MAG TPA: response regulator transcription factor [Rhodanobacteraceae bacterium]|jgi:DNA-binding NarL/FixJ family response regulator|nr:response regulator transcription factor [Rhodanobacteraceae bacterium]